MYIYWHLIDNDVVENIEIFANLAPPSFNCDGMAAATVTGRLTFRTYRTAQQKLFNQQTLTV